MSDRMTFDCAKRIGAFPQDHVRQSHPAFTSEPLRLLLRGTVRGGVLTSHSSPARLGRHVAIIANAANAQPNEDKA